MEQHEQDVIKDPSHYKGDGGMESIEAIRGMLGDNTAAFYRGNILKYLWRYEKKGGLQDLRKCHQYISLLIELETDIKLRDRNINITKLMNQTGAIR